MFSVRRATGWERWKCCWKTDPFFWESDGSTPNLTFFNVNDPSVRYYETGLSATLHGYRSEGVFGGWTTPKPEDGNEMYISLGAYAQIEKKCPLYCEKSGTYFCHNHSRHRLRTPNEGKNQKYLKNWSDVADNRYSQYLKIWDWD